MIRLLSRTIRPYIQLVLSCVLAIMLFVPSGIGQTQSIYQVEAELKRLYGKEKLDALNRLSMHYLPQGVRKALRYGRQAVNLADNLYPSGATLDSIEQDDHVKANYQLGLIYFERESFFESNESFIKARQLSGLYAHSTYLEDIDRHLREIQEMIDAGEIKEGILSLAFSDLNLGNTIKETTTDMSVRREVRLGEKASEAGDFNTAIGHYENAINRLRDLGDAEGIADLQIQIAVLLDSLDQHTKAQEFLDDAIREAVQSSAQPEMIEVIAQSDTIPELKTTDQIDLSSELKNEKDNLKKLSDRFAESKDYERSLEYYKLYQQLSQKMVADSLQLIDLNRRRASEITLLRQQKKIADLNADAAEQERIKQVRLRNTFIGIGLLVLISTLITLYYYLSKRKQHKKLSIAYRDLDKTKEKLVGAEQRIVKLLKQQVSGDVAQSLLMNDMEQPVERRFVCLMFLDIRNFTPMAEKLSPEELIKYQNDVFGFMIDIVEQHHGTINQLLGDGFMATFGAPISRGNDCQNAFDASVAILNEVKERIRAGVIPRTGFGIGLHAGQVVTGNVGNEARKQFSVTGNAVIIASRVEQLNKRFKSSLIITEAVYKKLDRHDNIESPFIDVDIKGRTKPIKIVKIA